MPRRPRRAEGGDDAMAAAEPLADTVPSGDQTEQPAKPRSRSRTRKKVAPTGEPSSTELDAAVNTTEATLDGQSAEAVGTVPKRRPSRRRTAPKTEAVVAAPEETSVAPVASSEQAPVPEPDGAAEAPATAGPRLKRVGGRRTAQAAAQAAQVAEEPQGEGAVDSAEEAKASRPRRSSGRRRRGAGSKPAGDTVALADEPIADQETVDVDHEVSEATIEDEAADGAQDEGLGESRRGRRSRRGSKRRGRGSDTPDGAAEGAQAGESVEVVVAPDEDDILVSTIAPPPIWNAPPLVPTLDDIGGAVVDMPVNSTIDVDAGMFVVEGESISPYIFFLNGFDVEDTDQTAREIVRATEAGVRIHSGIAFLPFENAHGERSFAVTDSILAQIMSADPEAWILLRLQIVPTNFWARTHGDQFIRYADGSEGDVSVASTVFWRDAADAIAALVAHLADPETVGGSRVIGFQIDKGEWFYDTDAGYDFSAPNLACFRNWLHEKYQSKYALRAAWYDGAVDFATAQIPPFASDKTAVHNDQTSLYNGVHDRKWIDYHNYCSQMMAKAITGTAEIIKGLTGGKYVVGVPYGYTMEFAQRNASGHQALGIVLLSPHVDFLAGPNSYLHRHAGGGGSFCGPVDSVRLHRKLWIVEDDTKTFLAREETPDTFNPKIESAVETVSVHARNALGAFVHGAGLTWMDLWGAGWLDDDGLWQALAAIRRDAETARLLRTRMGGPGNPDVAVIIDEASLALVRSDSAGTSLQASLIIKARELIVRSGASVGFYLQSDIALIPDSAKLFIFLNALRITTQERQAIRERVQIPGKTIAWCYAAGLYDEKGVSPLEVSEVVGMALKCQPWNSRVGTVFTEERHPVIERLHGGKRLGLEEIVNPSYTEVDVTARVLGEYVQNGNPSIAAKQCDGGWKSVFVGEPHLSGEFLRGLYRYAGVHVYDVQDDVIYATSEGVIVLHAPYTGQRTIHLPRSCAAYDLTEGRLLSRGGNSFRIFVRGRTTHLVLFAELALLADVLGVTEEELFAKQQRPNAREERENNNPNRNTEYDSPSEYNEEDGEAVRSVPQLDEMMARVGESLAQADAEVPLSANDQGTDSAEAGEVASAPSHTSRRRRWQRRGRSRRSGGDLAAGGDQAGAGEQRPAASPELVKDLLNDLAPRREQRDQ